MTATYPDEKLGWGWPGSAAKAHYFFDGPRSLCGRWMYTGERTAPLDPGRPSDCTPCRKKLAALKLIRTEYGIVSGDPS